MKKLHETIRIRIRNQSENCVIPIIANAVRIVRKLSQFYTTLSVLRNRKILPCIYVPCVLDIVYFGL